VRVVSATLTRGLTRLALVLPVALACAGCWGPLGKVGQLPPYEAPRAAHGLKVPYPILLLHGMGQKAEVWRGAATSYFSRDLELTFGGDVHGSEQAPGERLAAGDYYSVRFAEAFAPVDRWAREIEGAVRQVREATGAHRVILIGYSMGGLAARVYLTNHVGDHHVKRLVTVGTPHLGSPYARVWSWRRDLRQCVGEGGFVKGPMCSAALEALLQLQGDVPFDAPALADLRRPEDGGTYLQEVNRRVHPLDLDYISIVGQVRVFEDAKQMNTGALAEPLRRFLSLRGDGPAALLEPGDGIVSAESQDALNVEFFQSDRSRRRTARTVQVSSVHMDHLRQTAEVQWAGLEERPEIRGMGVFQRDRAAVLAVDFVDHIPRQCVVAVTAREGGGAPRTLVPEGPPAVIVTADGLVARAIVPLTAPGARVNEGVVLRVTVTNTFGYAAERTLEW
jgi:pimeloyl-ACP methyl ester carboxylesterase